jgi:hypothetical protein
MQDYLTIKQLLPKNCVINSRSTKCLSETHFCRCSPDKEDIIPVTSTCLSGSQIPSVEQCSGLYPPPRAELCVPPSMEQCSELYPPPTCALVECDAEVSACTPCPSQETVTLVTPTERLVTESQPAEIENAFDSSEASGGDIQSDIMNFINGFTKDKKDMLIVILGALNIIQFAIILFCQLCRACEGGDKKGVNEVLVVSGSNNDSVAMDKRATCDVDDYMIPIVELTSGNYNHIETET